MPGGWLRAYNLSNVPTIIRLANEVAGLRFGSDVVSDISTTNARHAPSSLLDLAISDDLLKSSEGLDVRVGAGFVLANGAKTRILGT